MIRTLLRFLYLTSLILWLGSMVYFSLFVTPKIFGTLSLDIAGKLVGALFPSYYGIGMASGLVLFLSALYFALKGKGRLSWLNTSLIALMFILTLYAGVALHPQIRATKAKAEATTESTERGKAFARFGRLHRLAIAVNTIVLLTGIGVVFITGSRREILFPDGE